MNSIERLKNLFSKFPAVGPRTASRFVFYLINQPKATIDELMTVLQELKNTVSFCAFCFQPFLKQSEETLCTICQDSARNRQLLCVVEKENDLLSIEATKTYKGLYFILGGVLTLKKTADDLRIAPLQERIKNPGQFGLPGTSIEEVIIAINPTPEGQATSILIQRALKELSPSVSFKITCLATGLPMGGELEYADDQTLQSAFEGRR